MPGILESKVTASDQLKAACGAVDDSESGPISEAASSFFREEFPSSGGEGGVKRRTISAVTRSMACSRCKFWN